MSNRGWRRLPYILIPWSGILGRLIAESGILVKNFGEAS